MALPDSARAFVESQRERVRRLPRKPRIVFPEGDDPRVIEATARLKQDGLIDSILVTRPQVESCPRLEKYAAIYYERRRAKGVTPLEAQQMARRPLFYSALMVASGDADGFVGGAVNTTAETVRAALHCIGTPPAVKTVSSVFVLCLQNPAYGQQGRIIFADPAIVINPTSVELAEITIASARTAKALLGIEPIVAMLSFSTKGSGGKHKDAEKVREALRIVQARAPELHVDGELQADAALVPSVGASKAPGSTVAGKANVLVFPNLDSCNIGSKLTERLGNAAAYGPFLQGLNKPANDLSRGCSAEDIYTVALVTALQALAS
jgi:phosphate acetyltransferase